MRIVFDIALPALFVVFVWWSSTGLIFALNGLSERTYGRSLLGAGVLSALALVALSATRAGSGSVDAAIAFTAAIIVWGLIEMTLLMGLITGPRRTPCPEQCSEWQRFLAASIAIAYHEGAILLALATLAWLTWDGSNLVGVTTFALLWLMRLSAKLNLFLGVPNPAAELLPSRIAFLRSYFRQAPMNALFPLSVTLATLTTGWFVQQAGAAVSSGADATPAVLLATLSLLGLIEHWFLILPIPPQALWSWSLPPQVPATKTSQQPIVPLAAAPTRLDRRPIVPSAA